MTANVPQDLPFPTRIAFAEARAILARVAAGRPRHPERLALSRAHGRVLAADLHAVLPQPVFDNAAMDGFAFRHRDLAEGGEQGLELAGEQFAGGPRHGPLAPGECARITTGAALPAGADTVVMKEDTRLEGTRVRLVQRPAAGAHVRHAGEDVAVGDLLLRAGDVLTPTRIALAAAQGLPELAVSPRPTVAVFTTGDELVEPGLPLAPGQIHDSNREQLMGLLRDDGFEPVAWPNLPDDPAHVASALRHAGHAFDLVLTCGAVSAGEKDHLPALLQAQGVVHFWKVRMKPGMPVLFASGGSLGGALFLCLPGNPVSVLATYLALGRHLLDHLQGRAPREPWHARLASGWQKRHGRMEFVRGLLHADHDGVLRLVPNPADGSHRMRAAADSNALAVLPEGEAVYPAGSVVQVLPFRG